MAVDPGVDPGKSKKSAPPVKRDPLREGIFATCRIVADGNARVKPPPLDQLWTIGDEELRPLADHLATGIESLPHELTEQVSRWSPWVAAVTSAFLIVVPRMQMEAQFVRSHQPGAPGPQGPAGGIPASAAAPDYGPSVANFIHSAGVYSVPGSALS